MILRKVFFFIVAVLCATTVSGGWFQDKQFFDTESVGRVVFSHDNHLEALGQNCEICHNKIYHIFPEKNPASTMAEMQQGKSCGACHNGKKAFSVSGNCTNCHPAGEIKWEREGLETQFSHALHLDKDLGCDECHPDLFKPSHNAQKMSMEAMEKGKYCGACHDGATAFSLQDCTLCHSVGEIKWQKDDVGVTRFSHSLHLAMGFSCKDCHPKLFAPRHNGQKMTMAAMKQGKYCGACHNGEIAFPIRECTSCHAGEITWKSEVTGITEFSHTVHIEAGFSCSECHPELFKAKFEGQDITMAAMKEGKYCGACHDGDAAFSIQDCTVCHAGELTWRNEDAGEVRFSHAGHIETGFGCSDCHPDPFKAKYRGQFMTMEAMADGAYCGSCHDGDTAFSVAEDCESCHLE